MYWTHARLQRRAERPADFAGRILPVERQRRLRERPVDGVQIELLMRRVRPGGRGRRGGDGQERRAIEKRVGDPERHVHGTGTKRGDADAGSPEHLAGHIRHE